MDVEINVHLHDQTRCFVSQTSSMNVNGSKWVFQTIHKVDGLVEHYKASLVIKGFN